MIDTIESVGFSHNGEATPYTELQAWCRESTLSLTLWEFETMKQLSEAYVSALQYYGADESLPPPFMTPEAEEKRAILQAELVKAMVTNSAAKTASKRGMG